MDEIDYKILSIIKTFIIQDNKYPRVYEIANKFNVSYISQQFIRNRIRRLVERKILIRLPDKTYKLNVSFEKIKDS